MKKSPHRGEPKGAESPDTKSRKPAEQEEEEKEEGMDKTLADSFPASDPPSSIPDPADQEEEDAA